MYVVPTLCGIAPIDTLGINQLTDRPTNLLPPPRDKQLQGYEQWDVQYQYQYQLTWFMSLCLIGYAKCRISRLLLRTCWIGWLGWPLKCRARFVAPLAQGWAAAAECARAFIARR